MEKTIKRVEKLVHSTNTALAQMQYNLSFDDLSEDPGLKFWSIGAEGRWLDMCQQELRSDIRNILKVERLLGSEDFSSARKASKARDKMKEINMKMESLRLEKGDAKESEQRRRKPISLAKEEEPKSSGKISSAGSVASPQSDPKEGIQREKELEPRKSGSAASPGKTASKSKEELKTRIRETREIVDRGFQTARELTQKVESMTAKSDKRSTGSWRMGSEINLTTLEPNQKSGSNDSMEVSLRRCCKHSRRKRRKDPKEENNRVVDVKRGEVQGRKLSNLTVQTLPSLDIRGGLQLQKIHNFEILPEKGNAVPSRTNTAIDVISHEQIQKEKADKFLEEARKIHRCEDDRGERYVECFNCGKMIRLRGTRVDPKRAEDVLRECDFDVFDPRIDELVENYHGPVREEKPSKQPEEKDSPRPKLPERTFKIHHLGEQLSKRYKQEAENFEERHLKLDTVLQHLFKRVEESRKVFEDCRLLSSKQKPRNLSLSKTELVSFVGEEGKPWRRERRKLGRRDVANRKKSGTPESEAKSEAKSEAREPEESAPQGRPAANVGNEITLPSEEVAAESGRERSENDYESDFEGDSDLPEERKECGAGSLVKSLSTIAEADSLAEKFSDDDGHGNLVREAAEAAAETADAMECSGKTRKNFSPAVDVPPVEPQERRSGASDESGGNTRNASKASPSQKSTPTELVTSLKDILSALREQFARTESLAEKLTENVKTPNRGLGSWGPSLSPKLLTGPMLEKDADGRLRSAQAKSRDASRARGQEKLGLRSRKGSETSENSLTEEGGSSVGEVVLAGGKSDSSPISECFVQLESGRTSSRMPSGVQEKREGHFKLGLNSEEASYSEGEIRSRLLVESECESGHSVGEVLSDRVSRGSTVT